MSIEETVFEAAAQVNTVGGRTRELWVSTVAFNSMFDAADVDGPEEIVTDPNGYPWAAYRHKSGCRILVPV